MSVSILDNKTLLHKYLPEQSVDNIYNFIVNHCVHFKIVSKRMSKLGDYSFRPPNIHRITINNNLNPYHFLFVTLHEFAHLKAFQSNKRKQISPHGKEWKQEFQILLNPYLAMNLFPEDLNGLLKEFIKNPSASSGANGKLLKCFEKYNLTIESNSIIRVEDIPMNSFFRLRKMVFRKVGKRRTRYTCELIPNKKIYFVHGLAEVEALHQLDIK